MISLAAQQYTGRAAPVDGDEAAANSSLAGKASEAVLKNRNWCIVKKYVDMLQDLDAKEAAKILARHVKEVENKRAGVVLDPPKRQKRLRKTIGQQQVKP
jgi:F0F1-type ATP synthase gamma subunit